MRNLAYAIYVLALVALLVVLLLVAWSIIAGSILNVPDPGCLVDAYNELNLLAGNVADGYTVTIEGGQVTIYDDNGVLATGDFAGQCFAE